MNNCFSEHQRIVGYLDELAGQVAALARLQSKTAAAVCSRHRLAKGV
jgi:hypothetical protein